MLHHRKVTQTLTEIVVHSFKKKNISKLLLLAGTVPGAGDLIVNVRGQFSDLMKLMF